MGKKPSLLVTGGKIWTGVKGAPFAEALLVRGSKIAAIGTKEEVAGRAKMENTVTLELGGNLVLPGLTDSHIHLGAFAKQKNAVDLFGLKSKREFLDKIREKALQSGPGDWIYGCRFNETTWDVPAVPNRADLDSLDIPNPVLVMRICAHVNVANTKAMVLAGLDTEGSLSSGILNEEAAFPILEVKEKAERDPERQEELIRKACSDLAECGITSAHICGAAYYGMEEDLSFYQSLHSKQTLPVRVISYHDEIPNLKIKSGFGDDWVAYGGYKTFLDGSLGGRTAALTKDYSDAPGVKGVLNHKNEELLSSLEEVTLRGIQSQIHAIGDAALDQALEAIGKVQEKFGKPELPFRVNHAIVCRPDQLEKIRTLGIAIDIQPVQAFSDRHMAPTRLGAERIATCYVYRDMADAGVPMLSSSDSPVEDINPWEGIWAGVTRRDGDEYLCCFAGREQRLTLQEMLETYIVIPQEVTGRGSRLGKLAEGYLADFTILDCDPFGIPAEDLKKVRSTHTVAGGRLSCGKIEGWPSIGG
jgi:predicted amidohydrolase YtcJ